MRALALAALLCAVCFVAPAAAHGRHVRHRWSHALVHRDGSASRRLRALLHYVEREREPPLARTALRYVGRRKFTRFRGPWCRDAVNVWLRQAGFRTDGSRLALRALALGPHLRRPVPGAIGVMRRRGGGHVVVIVGRRGDQVQAVSPNWRHMVALVAYPIRRFVAFVRPERVR